MARHKQSYSGERLTTGLRVQLTPSQRQELAASAAASGATLSDFAREQMFRKGGQPVTTAGARRNPEAKALLDELRRIGNNLNQLAHRANADQMIAEQRELHETITLLKAAMGRVVAL
jgi:mobilization protein NikA